MTLSQMNLEINKNICILTFSLQECCVCAPCDEWLSADCSLTMAKQSHAQHLQHKHYIPLTLLSLHRPGMKSVQDCVVFTDRGSVSDTEFPAVSLAQ